MNATDDGLEPLGESPAIEVQAATYSHEYPVTYYQARCTSCGHVQAEYGDYSAMDDVHGCIEILTSCDPAWFVRHRYEPAPTPECPRRQIVHVVELLCPDCQRCEVCGSATAYVIDEGEPHMVCESHESHDFDGQPQDAARPRLFAL